MSDKAPDQTDSNASNRRTADRSAVDVLMNRYMDGEPYLCVALDVSRTGMRVRPLLGPKNSSRFMGLQFQLPGSDEVLTASGEKVRNSETGELAVRFTYVPPAARSAIDRFLS